MSGTALVAAPAKVNLFLGVLDRRPDGYHEIDTLFQAIDLVDEVRVQRVGATLELDVEGGDVGPAHENLARRAAARLLAHLEFTGGVHVRLTKRIPIGAGLGGGSSDAAAVLRCLGSLTGRPDEDPLLRSVAAELGSDVPFFLSGSPLAHGRGRGGLLEPLEPLPETELVLVSPPVHVSTAAAYRALDEARSDQRAGSPSRLASVPTAWEDVEAVARNDFQGVIAGAHPAVARSLAALETAGARPALMSGSGSSVFGLFPDHTSARGVAARLTEELGWPCRAVRTLTGVPPVRLS